MRAVRTLDVAAASDSELRALYALAVAEEAEHWPEDPMDPYDQWRTELIDQPSWQKKLIWVVPSEDGDRWLDQATLVLRYTEDNRTLADLSVFVDAAERGAGLAADLLRPVAEAAEADGRTLLQGGGPTSTGPCSRSGWPIPPNGPRATH